MNEEEVLHMNIKQTIQMKLGQHILRMISMAMKIPTI